MKLARRIVLVGSILLISATGFVFKCADWWIGELVFEIQLRKAEFYVDEPVVATVVWRNESRISLGLEYLGVITDSLGYYEGVATERDFEMSVVYEGRERLDSHGRQVEADALVQYPLPPGSEIRRAVRLEKGFDLSREGQYRLQVIFEPWLGKGDKGPGLVGRWLSKRFRSVAEVDFDIQSWTVNSLAKVLKDAKAQDSGAIYLLGLHGSSESIPLLSKSIVSEEREVRYEAAHALGRLGSPEAIRVLGVTAVEELDPKLKTVMAVILMRLDSPEGLPWLRMMLEDSVVVREHGHDPRIRSFNLRALVWGYLRDRGEEGNAVLEEAIFDEKP